MAVERILIDANSLGHAAHQGTVLKSGDQETQAIYGVIKSARHYRVRYPGASLIFLWDGNSWRKEKSEVYKANRTDTPDKVESRRRYKTQAPHIRRALSHLGLPQLAATNYEADDLAAHLAQRYLANGEFVRMVSGDRDWWQLLADNCVWEDHRDEAKKVSIRTFPTFSGYPNVKQFVQSKALQGDTSDNLPGVGQIGEKRAKELLNVWGSVEWFLADKDRVNTWKSSGISDKPMHKAFKDFASMEDRQANFFHNMHMMNLLGDLPPPENMRLNKGEFNPEAFKTLCHEFGFASIYRPESFDHWVEPFSKK